MKGTILVFMSFCYQVTSSSTLRRVSIYNAHYAIFAIHPFGYITHRPRLPSESPQWAQIRASAVTVPIKNRCWFSFRHTRIMIMDVYKQPNISNQNYSTKNVEYCQVDDNPSNSIQKAYFFLSKLKVSGSFFNLVNSMVETNFECTSQPSVDSYRKPSMLSSKQFYRPKVNQRSLAIIRQRKPGVAQQSASPDKVIINAIIILSRIY